jgi:hypothetical protein
MELEEEDGRSFREVLHEMAHPAKKRDPRTVRLAAVTSAVIEVIGNDNCSASEVYAKTVTALEGTLTATSGESVTDSISTQMALLQVLSTTVPHVNPPAILMATLPLTSRVLRAVVSSIQAISDETVMETKDELGGANAVLRWACRASGEILKSLNSNADEKSVNQFFLGTLVALFRDRRPNVRKAAQDGVVEVLVSQETGNNRHPVIIRTMSAYVHSELAKVAKSQSMDSFSDLLQFLPFVERSILYLNYAKLSSDVMELLTALLKVQDMSSTTDFVTVAKIREVTPKIQTIDSLLSIVANMLEDDNIERKTFLDEFACRVLASQLQTKPHLVFRQGAAEFEVLERGRIQFGQTLLAASSRALDTNKELACKLLPLCIQLLLVLSRPSEVAADDATVAETLLVELTQLFRAKLNALVEARPTSLDKCLSDMIRHMEQIMQPPYKAAWSVGLKCFAVLLKHVHSTIPIHTSVENLIRLRNGVPLGSPLQHVVEDSVSTLVQELGMETCWELFGFQSDSKQNGMSEFTRWVFL